MPFLGFRERIQLRRAVAAGINNGKLPQSAALVLSDRDAFAELELPSFGYGLRYALAETHAQERS